MIVAHSHKLAQGVCDLAGEMAPDVRIVPAGGLDDKIFGTNMERIVAALEVAWSDSGVLVLMDLGSAVMSAEMAVEMLPPDRKGRVWLSEAPIVEGAIAAAVCAASGASLEQVAQAALEARHIRKLGDETEDAIEADTLLSPGVTTQEVRLQVRNRVGLHARPAAMFAQTAMRFAADVRVRDITTNGALVNAKSLISVIGLGAGQGHEIAIRAAGPDAADALDALRQLVEETLVELEPPETGVAPTEPSVELEAQAADELAPGILRGIGAADGVAIGPAHHYGHAVLEVERRSIDDPATEWERFLAAADVVADDLERVRQRAVERIGSEEAGIFGAQAMLLSDPEFLSRVRQVIEKERVNSEAAVEEVTGEFADRLAGIDLPVFQSRATDVRTVGQRVVKRLLGREVESPVLPDHRVVLIARELTPGETVGLDVERVLGFCTAAGGATSHTAILARALGLPAVVGLGDTILRVADETPLIIDGAAGQVLVDPDESTQARYADQRARQLSAAEQALQAAQQLAFTKDGRRVEVVANAGDVVLAQRVLEYGAEGIGLLRTEFLYLGRDSLPDEEAQYQVYRAVADLLGELPLIIRTLDIGGDKQVPYLDLGEEMNPFLGWRAIRISLDRPDLFKTQLRAILRAGHDRNVKVMFPLVASIDDVRRARALLHEVQTELSAAGVDHVHEIDVGIMIEVPGAAVLADRLAHEVDFFSIGTNDLVQYTLAVDRGNERVAGYSDPFHPAVLRLLKSVIDGAHAAGVWVGLCGELAGQPDAIPLLLGLGLDEFSMEPASIPRAKQIIRQLTTEEARQIADTALSFSTGHEVSEYLRTRAAMLDG
ncbi:MAG: phosphoenolpyruvate--protein phosphotransferase [Anaerolineae bacterium]